MKKLFSTKYTDRSVSFAQLLLRIAIAGLMLVHGYDKLTHFKAYTQMLPDPFHLGGTITTSLVVFAEFFCAAMVLIGLLTRLAAIPLVINMGVALHFAHHWRVTADGETAALFFAGFLAILITGPGKISMDRLIGK